jgi:hypothetical protein
MTLAPMAPGDLGGSKLGASLLCGLVLIYTTGYLLWYSATPLGLYPVLDGREMVASAIRMANDGLPPEPFYRAPVYPALLALAVKAGLPAAELPIFARLLNGLLHMASTMLVWSIARVVWRRTASAFVSAGLFGFNPVVLHFAGDPLDITLAITLMLGGIRSAVASQTAVSVRRGRGRFAHTLSALAPAVLILCVFGFVNHEISGDFRILPWQGAYNLWSANKIGAHGRYFEQTAPVHSYDDLANAARLESERLYTSEHPGVAAPDHGQITAYWRARAIERIVSDPLSWGKQMAGKFYYLVNDFEQYNNKTYTLHKARSPWLAPNPIGWSLLLIAGTIGIGFARRSEAIRLIVLCGIAYAAGVLLFYVSARFRLPLVPMLAVCAGVIGDLKQRLTIHTVREAALVLGSAAVIGGVSLFPIAETERHKTYVQDYLLLSRAASQLGVHDRAFAFAQQAAGYDAGMATVIDTLCITGFNASLLAGGSDPPPRVIESVQANCQRAASFSDPAARLLGIILWRSGRDEDAVGLWREVIDRGSPEHENLLAALVMVWRLRPADVAQISAIAYTRMSDNLLLALALSGDAQAIQEVAGRFTTEQREIQFRSLRGLFDVRRRGSN